MRFITEEEEEEEWESAERDECKALLIYLPDGCIHLCIAYLLGHDHDDV